LAAADPETTIRRLKAERAGEIQVAAPVQAQSLSEAGLIDQYRLYLHNTLLGGGQPFFGGNRPHLHLVGSDLIADDVIRMSYVPYTWTTSYDTGEYSLARGERHRHTRLFQDRSCPKPGQ
jgi:dihydrofolate reductase